MLISAYRLMRQGKEFTIVMSNDGKIIPIVMRENIFRPFVQYRDGKDIVPGTGIGLALARSLAELHQGTLTMDQDMECNRFIFHSDTASDGFGRFGRRTS